MNSRIAKKVYGYLLVDPQLRPTEQTPYSYAQVVRAASRVRLCNKRWKRADPTLDTWAKWNPAKAFPATKASIKRGPIGERWPNKSARHAAVVARIKRYHDRTCV
jgi:hypothetical protein